MVSNEDPTPPQREVKPEVIKAAEVAGVRVFHLKTGQSRAEVLAALEAEGINLGIRDDLQEKFDKIPSHAAIVFVCILVNGMWLSREDISEIIKAAANARLSGRGPVPARTKFIEFVDPVDWTNSISKYLQAARKVLPGEILSRGGKPAYAERLAQILIGGEHPGLLQFDQDLAQHVFEMGVMYLDSLIVMRDLLSEIPTDEGEGETRYIINFSLDDRVRAIVDANLTQLGVHPPTFWNTLTEVTIGGRWENSLQSELVPQHMLTLLIGACIRSDIVGKERRELMNVIFEEVIPLIDYDFHPPETQGSFLTIRAAAGKILDQRGVPELKVLIP